MFRGDRVAEHRGGQPGAQGTAGDEQVGCRQRFKVGCNLVEKFVRDREDVRHDEVVVRFGCTRLAEVRKRLQPRI